MIVNLMVGAFLLWASGNTSNDVYLMQIQTEGWMRTTLNLDDDLLEEAHKLTGVRERTALIHEGLRALISRESARRLARLGGTDPNAKAVRRRRPRER
jgi:Arc/MetJ family transcription regulator